jgi:hypothetical protein
VCSEYFIRTELCLPLPAPRLLHGSRSLRDTSIPSPGRIDFVRARLSSRLSRPVNIINNHLFHRYSLSLNKTCPYLIRSAVFGTPYRADARDVNDPIRWQEGAKLKKSAARNETIKSPNFRAGGEGGENKSPPGELPPSGCASSLAETLVPTPDDRTFRNLFRRE